MAIGGLARKVALSKEMSDFIGAPEASRPEVVKAFWAYVKSNKCQDPANKQMIVPDAKLATIMGSEPCGMLKIMGKLSPHFIKK
jgi:chromatin remodeling complex protein RSC6